MARFIVKIKVKSVFYMYNSNDKKCKISVFTLGCKTNLYESGQIIERLNSAGYDAFHGLKKADVFVLNTCAITKEAEKVAAACCKSKKAQSELQNYSRRLRFAKDSKQFSDIPNVTLIAGVADKTRIAEEIEKVGTFIDAVPSVYSETCSASQERTRAFVKIQDGCNNFCSYCIVPYLRGRSRSRKIADVVQEINSSKSAETVLIGIDISQFGKDTGESLPRLFRSLQGIKTRIRLGSLEAGVVTDELLESLTEIDFCPHFHLSLQSGCDTVLKRMNRKIYYSAVFRGG